METTKLRRFAQYARRTLLEQVAAKIGMVLANDSAARRENVKTVQDLEKQIKETSKEHVTERVAYTWFNRFCALRFMDVNRYSRIGVVSPLEGQFQPEILAEAKMGHLDEEMVPGDVRQQITALLNGSATSRDPQQEAYRLLVVAACNDFHRAMPYLFERIADYTELLMPDDLLSGNSILAYTREAMTPDTCQDVEVVGWLYQFYISEKKDEVFKWLKKGRKIEPENIPAATQLFTPHWIVRYLLENSLGRLWLLNRPDSRLVDQMDYYIKPERSETDFLRISKPEDIKVCDPACGSGHMLTYAFDLLYAIYEEEGTDPAEIPEKILKHNLYGIEIDERAGELAAFALTMKARAKQRRFLIKRIQPKICVLQNVEFDKDELDEYMPAVGRDLFNVNLREALQQFSEADNFGSLIRPVLSNVADILPTLEAKNMIENLFLAETHKKVLIALKQADYLSPKYHVVVANPPYMGSKGMNPRLGVLAKDNYPYSKSDLFAMFIERNLDLAIKRGMVSMITMQSWMFLGAFERFRMTLLTKNKILSMAHLGTRAFDSIGGEIVSTTAFVLSNTPETSYMGAFLKLTDGACEEEKNRDLKLSRRSPYLSSANDLMKIPGCLIAYWVSKKTINAFAENKKLADVLISREGLTSGDNSRFLRIWTEVSIRNICFDASSNDDAKNKGRRWFPHLKGGEYRKWAGNTDYIVDWMNDGYEMKNFSDQNTGRIRSHNYNGEWAFKKGLTWSSVSSGNFCVRHSEGFSMFDTTGTMAFPQKMDDLTVIESYLNSKVSTYLMTVLAPTIRFQPGHALNLPFKEIVPLQEKNNGDRCIDIAQKDWDSYETSWDFSVFPMLQPEFRQPSFKATYIKLRAYWREITLKMQCLEEENNRIFIEAYGLQDELRPEVSLDEISLTCNPRYRYDRDKSEVELESLLMADTMVEFISYTVGCMFGRYSLDKPGLILANQGETLDDYLREVPEPTFAPDADNVIPLLDGDWFADDIAERFRNILRVTFGDEHYEENVQFIEESLGKKGKPQSIRDYFLKDFYTDHVKRYKKRPIYWMFSSPKGSFNALIYMHRYRPDTVGVVLNDYLREFRTKLAARKSHLEQISISGSASAGEKTKALKEIEILKKNIVELEGYERDVLYPLATQQLEINLDGGVKANYSKFGAALNKKVGLDAIED